MNTKKIISLLARLALLVKEDEEGNSVHLCEDFREKEVLDTLKTIDGSQEVVEKLERYLSLPNTWGMDDKEEAAKINNEGRELYKAIYNFKSE